MKIGYIPLDYGGIMGSAYVAEDPDVHGIHWGTTKHSTEPIGVRWDGKVWREIRIVIGIDPAHDPVEATTVAVGQWDGHTMRFVHLGVDWPVGQGAPDFYEQCRAALEKQMREGTGGWSARPMCPPEAASKNLTYELSDYPSQISLIIERQLKAATARADIAAVRILARFPWALHWLAATPAWKAYVTALRKKTNP